MWENKYRDGPPVLKECWKELIDFLGKKQKTFNIVVMPDFFMDRLVNLECNAENFVSEFRGIVARTGGSIDQVVQSDLRGGNAINVTSALLALGINVTPIVCTSSFGLEQIRFHFKDYRLNTSHIKLFPKASITTALEVTTEDGKANVMIRDLGSLADFGPKDLNEEDYSLIERADYVCLFNWAGTRNRGTELAESVFGRAKSKGKCKTYLDTADPVPNKDNIPQLINKILESDLVDVLSVNENEAVTYASFLSNEVNEQRKRIEFNELALLSAQILAKNFHARIDLHTTTFSTTVTPQSAVLVPSFKVKPFRVTGAGDAWDAGNLMGDALGLSDECRLTLANAVSACYLSDLDGLHPNRQKVAEFLMQA